MFVCGNCGFGYLYVFGWFWVALVGIAILADCLFAGVMFCCLLFSLVLGLRWCLGIVLVGFSCWIDWCFDVGLALVLFKANLVTLGVWYVVLSGVVVGLVFLMCFAFFVSVYVRISVDFGVRWVSLVLGVFWVLVFGVWFWFCLLRVGFVLWFLIAILCDLVFWCFDSSVWIDIVGNLGGIVDFQEFSCLRWVVVVWCFDFVFGLCGFGIW